MEDVFVCKLPLENEFGEFVTVYSKWTNSCFSLKISHGESAWEGDVSHNTLKSLSEISGCKLEQYVSDTKRALTSDGGSADFTYSLHEAEFSWKKIIDGFNNIKVKFGYMLLEKTNASSVAETIMETLLDRCIFLKMNDITLRKENNELKVANMNLRTQCAKISRLKTEMEEAIYAKMLLVLNAKKEKIIELENQNETIKSSSENPLRKNPEIKSIDEDTDASTASDLYGSETELDSSEDSTEIPSKLARIGESETAFGVKKELGHVSPNNPLANACGKDQCPEVDLNTSDLFLPTRPKKNTKSKFAH